MADPRRLREILGFGYGAPSPAMSALEPFHAGVDPAYMPQDKVTASIEGGPSPYVHRGIEAIAGLFAPSDRVAAETAGKLNAVADFNPLQGAYDFGKAAGDALQGGDPTMLAMSMIPGKAADELVPAVKAAQKGIRAYHSSPHSFEKFDISKIGTGEGAQAYGHGLYAAESPAVSGRGGQYDRQFTAKKMGKTDTTPFEEAILREMGDDTSISDAEILHRLQTKGFGWKGPDGYPAYEEMEEAIKNTRANASHIYEVNINADPDAFLDWDKPLSEQPHVQEALPKMGYKPAQWPYSGWTSPDNRLLTTQDAESLLRSAGPKGTGEAALKQAGIPGIKYLDAGSRPHMEAYYAELKKYQQIVEESRNQLKADPNNPALKEALIKNRIELNRIERVGPGSRNYVVFSDEIIDIVKKYGIAGALGAGLITQQMADQLEAQQGGGQS